VHARCEDLRDLVERELELLVAREVVRPQADAGVGAAATLGLALLILTGRVVALRKRGSLAF